MRLALVTLACACALALGGCGDALQTQPIPHNLLERLIISPYPIYWLGGSFHGLSVSEAAHDPGGAYRVSYGNCLRGGQATCVVPLSVITSPNDSLLPGRSLAHADVRLRGVNAVFSQGGRTIAIATGAVVLDIYANTAHLALAAARTAVPINRIAAPGSPLAAPVSGSDFATKPLPVQIPSAPRQLP